ncbi:hypothetical protein ER45_029040 (plasmid) [Bacillus mycoides]|nr:hypothetical protein ER45_029040 [Bacillus mycoides]
MKHVTAFDISMGKVLFANPSETNNTDKSSFLFNFSEKIKGPQKIINYVYELIFNVFAHIKGILKYEPVLKIYKSKRSPFHRTSFLI